MAEDIARIAQELHYDPETGRIAHARKKSSVKPGDPAEHRLPNGYAQVFVARRPYLAHRVAFAISHGRWPNGDIDHINGDRWDNRLCNLREATRSQNIFAAKNGKRGKSGIRGVKQVGTRWRAQIRVNGRLLHLGYFGQPGDAQAAYRAAAVRHFGEFAEVA